MNIPPMQYRVMGRTGLRVSLLSLGSGGPNQFGQRRFVPQLQIISLIHRALDLGVNFIDTAPSYGQSEAILGRALRGVLRDRYILASKLLPVRDHDGVIATPDEVVTSVERSLKRLNVDTIDLMQFHRVTPEMYHTVVDRLLPTFEKLKRQGKFRFLGITESTSKDYNHEMLPMALADNAFDTIMVGYNFMNHTPEHHLLPMAQQKQVGVICMTAVRNLLMPPDYIRKKISDLKARGFIVPKDLLNYNHLSWLIKKEGLLSLPALGYKYIADHPATTSVLTGTTNIEHLEENVRVILSPPLLEEDMARLRRIFSNAWEPLTK
ncbi:MAG: aldo/keto reductase [Thermodesulfobacteriota bacterium]